MATKKKEPTPAEKRKVIKLLKQGYQPRSIAIETGVDGRKVLPIARKAGIAGLAKAAHGMGRPRRLVRQIQKLHHRQTLISDRLEAKYRELYDAMVD